MSHFSGRCRILVKVVAILPLRQLFCFFRILSATIGDVRADKLFARREIEHNKRESMKRIGKFLRSLFLRSTAVCDGQDERREKVDAPADKDRHLALRVIKTVEQKRLFLRPGLSIADVASEMNAEADAVERLFTRFIGGDFNRYLDELRIAYAAVLFMGQESDLYSLDKIGTRCGFRDNDAFVGACRKLTGMTPEVMREFTRGRETLKGLFLDPPIYLKSDTLEEESSNTNI